MFKMFEEPPYEDILDSLKEIQKKLENHPLPIEWDFVRFHLGSMDKLKQNSEFFYDVFEYVLRLLTVYRCREFSIIADTFQLESFVFEYSANSFRKARIMTNKLKENEVCCETNSLNFIAKLMQMPYKSHNLPFNLMYDVIQMHIVSAEEKILKYLLEYGVMYIPLSDHKSIWMYIQVRMSILLNDSDKKLLLSSCAIEAKFKELSPESRKRMLAVFRGVEVILKAKWNCPIEFALCFRMAYETIPEPIITSNEVANFLKLVLHGSSVDTCVEVIRTDYEKLFPESCEPLSPRTLKHLSRCQVRQNMRQTRCFPWGVLDLKVPGTLKDYIVSVENDYMHEQYNSYRT